MFLKSPSQEAKASNDTDPALNLYAGLAVLLGFLQFLPNKESQKCHNS